MDSQTNKLKPKQIETQTKGTRKENKQQIMQINNKYIFYQKRERERKKLFYSG